MLEILAVLFTLALMALPVVWLRRIERRARHEQLIADIEKFLQDH